MSSARSSVLAIGPPMLVERIRRPGREPPLLAQLVVRLEQLSRVADVAPLASGGEAVDRRARHEPGEEAARLVGRVPLVEVALEERDVLAVVDVGGGRDERRGRMLRLLGKAREALVVVEVDARVLPDELEVADVVEHDGARRLLALPEGD